MSKRTTFIGHRDFLPRDIEQRLKKAIKKEIDSGCRFFTMGAHGKFDSEAFYVCKSFRKDYKDIEIEVAITSFNQIKPDVEEDEFGKFVYEKFEGAKTTMYDIEEVHFKKKITESNKQMIDGCDTLICSVRPKQYRSGAKTAMNYAKRKGLRIINLYKPEDDPFYGMTEEEKQNYFKKN